MKKNLLFTLILAAIGFGSCTKAKDSNPETSGPGGCFPPTMNCNFFDCTAQFAEVVVNIKDASGAAVTLDSFVVTDLSGTPLPPSSWGIPVYGYLPSGNGQYAIINDAWADGRRNSCASVQALGFIKGVHVFKESYEIFVDCCHVGKKSGKDAIVLP